VPDRPANATNLDVASWKHGLSIRTKAWIPTRKRRGSSPSCEPTEETAAVVVGAEDAFAAVAAVDDVVPAAGIEHAQRPGHAASPTALDSMSII
jgi:hypothetical protein